MRAPRRRRQGHRQGGAAVLIVTYVEAPAAPWWLGLACGLGLCWGLWRVGKWQALAEFWGYPGE